MADGDDFDVRVERAGVTADVCVAGDLDAHTGRRLRAVLHDHVEAGALHLTLHADRLTFLDSDGLRVLLDFDSELRSRGGGLRLTKPTEHVRRVLEMTDLVEHFGVD